MKTLVGDASQDGAKQLPYKNISHYGIQISGLPAGITLKNPSAMVQSSVGQLLSTKIG